MCIRPHACTPVPASLLGWLGLFGMLATQSAGAANVVFSNLSQFPSAANIATPGDTVVINGGELQITGAVSTPYDFDTVITSRGASFSVVNPALDLVFSPNSLAGNSSLTFKGPGSYSIGGDTSQFTGSLALQAIRLTNTLGTSFANASRLDLINATLHTADGQVLNNFGGSGALEVDGPLTLNNTLGNDTLFSGSISKDANTSFPGTAALNKTGAGQLTLSGTGTLPGAMTVFDGTLALVGRAAIGDTSALVLSNSTAGIPRLDLGAHTETVGSFTLNGGMLAGSPGFGVVLTATTYTLVGTKIDASAGLGPGALIIDGSTTTTVDGTLRVDSVLIQNDSTLDLTGPGRLLTPATMTVESGSELIMSLDTIGALAGAGLVTQMPGGLLVIEESIDTTFSGVIAGSSAVLKTGTANLTLSGHNTYSNIYSGGTVVVAGTLTLGASDVLPDTTYLSVGSSATLDLGAHTETVGSFTLNGGVLAGSGTLIAPIYTLNGGTVNANLGAGALTQVRFFTTLNGNSAAATLTVRGGTLLLKGTSAASTVNVIGGTLTLGVDERLTDSAALTLANGGTLDLGLFHETVANLAVNGGTLAGVPIGKLTAASYTLNNATVNVALGTGVLVQNGGTSTLGATGVNSTHVSSGTLVLAAADAIAASNQVDIAAGATLRATNTVQTLHALGGSGRLDVQADRVALDIAGSSVFDGTLTGVAGTLEKRGAGQSTPIWCARPARCRSTAVACRSMPSAAPSTSASPTLCWRLPAASAGASAR